MERCTTPLDVLLPGISFWNLAYEGADNKKDKKDFTNKFSIQ